MASSILVTMIGRLGDGLIMAASLDDGVPHGRLLEPQTRAKQLLRNLNYSSPPRASLEAYAFTVHYLLEQDVIYLCICERSTSQDRVFNYLQDLARSFWPQYQEKIKIAVRPYCFIEFDSTIQQLKKSVGSRRRVSGLSEVQKELHEVQKIVHENIDNVLERGAALTDLESRASGLSEMSKRYRKEAKNLHLRSFYAKAVAGGILTLVVILYFFVL